jgi:hypothetical protein
LILSLSAQGDNFYLRRVRGYDSLFVEIEKAFKEENLKTIRQILDNRIAEFRDLRKALKYLLSQKASVGKYVLLYGLDLSDLISQLPGIVQRLDVEISILKPQGANFWMILKGEDNSVNVSQCLDKIIHYEYELHYHPSGSPYPSMQDIYVAWAHLGKQFIFTKEGISFYSAENLSIEGGKLYPSLDVLKRKYIEFCQTHGVDPKEISFSLYREFLESIGVDLVFIPWGKPIPVEFTELTSLNPLDYYKSHTYNDVARAILIIGKTLPQFAFPLAEYFKDHESAIVRFAALEVLENVVRPFLFPTPYLVPLNNDELLTLLMEYAYGDNLQVSIKAIEILHESNIPREELNGASIECLRYLYHRYPLVKIFKALNEIFYPVTLSSRALILEMDEGKRSKLLELASDPQKCGFGIWERAIICLAWAGEEEVLPIIDRYLKDENPWIRNIAEWALRILSENLTNVYH